MNKILFLDYYKSQEELLQAVKKEAGLIGAEIFRRLWLKQNEALEDSSEVLSMSKWQKYQDRQKYEAIKKTKVVRDQGHYWCRSTYEELAEYCGCSISQIKRTLSILIEKGYLCVERFLKTVWNQVNFYRICWPFIAKTSANPQKTASVYPDPIIKKELYNINNNYNNNIYTRTKKFFLRHEAKMETYEWDPNAVEMIKIWNKYLKEKKELSINPSLNGTLASLYCTKFESDLRKWEKFCLLILSSKTLMAPKWHLNINHILELSTVDEILNEGWGVRSEKLPSAFRGKKSGNYDEKSEIAPTVEEIIDLIKTKIKSATERDVRLKLISKIGALDYRSWFDQCGLQKLGAGYLLKTPNDFVKNRIEGYYANACKDLNIKL